MIAHEYRQDSTQRIYSGIFGGREGGFSERVIINEERKEMGGGEEKIKEGRGFDSLNFWINYMLASVELDGLD